MKAKFAFLYLFVVAERESLDLGRVPIGILVGVKTGHECDHVTAWNEGIVCKK